MKKIRVNYIFRKRGEGHNSIEELFQSIISNLPDHIDAQVVELPQPGASLKSVLLNIWHVLFLKGVIHVTGDVYYVGLIPFKKTILTVHDVHFLKGSYLKKLLLKLFWVTLPVLFVKRITLVSEFSKREFLKLVPYAHKKVTVIYNPVNPLLIKKNKAFGEPPRVLHLGTKTNKNLINTIKGLHGIQCKLIVLGPLNQSQIDTLNKYTIDYLNYVQLPFTEIKDLYENSDIVSFISLYEGFGMPIIEAQRVGRVVITSKEASIPEVASDGAYFVNPNKIEEIAEGFNKLINDENLRKKLINKGFRNVERFNFETIIGQYVSLYKQIIGEQ